MSEQMVRIAFTHDEVANLLDGVEEGMAVVDQLAGVAGIAISDELRVFHMRLKWAHALLCAAAPSPAECYAAMPEAVADRLTLDTAHPYTGPSLKTFNGTVGI